MVLRISRRWWLWVCHQAWVCNQSSKAGRRRHGPSAQLSSTCMCIKRRCSAGRDTTPTRGSRGWLLSWQWAPDHEASGATPGSSRVATPSPLPPFSLFSLVVADSESSLPDEPPLPPLVPAPSPLPLPHTQKEIPRSRKLLQMCTR